MAFIREGQRFLDPERNIELLRSGGSSSGRLRFVLRGADFEVPFSAFREAKNIEGADPKLPVPMRSYVIWKIGGFEAPECWTRDKFAQLLTEVFSAYRYSGGLPDNQLVKICFAKNDVWES